MMEKEGTAKMIAKDTMMGGSVTPVVLQCARQFAVMENSLEMRYVMQEVLNYLVAQLTVRASGMVSYVVVEMKIPLLYVSMI